MAKFVCRKGYMLFQISGVKKVQECGRGVQGRGVNVNVEVTRYYWFRREGIYVINEGGKISEKIGNGKRRWSINC